MIIFPVATESTFNLESKKCKCQGNYFPSYVYLKDVYKTSKEIGKTQFLNNFAKSVNFTGVVPMKIWNYQSLHTNPYVGKLTLVQYILLILPFPFFEEQCLAQRFCKLSGKVIF